VIEELLQCSQSAGRGADSYDKEGPVFFSQCVLRSQIPCC
jgi:hypothetical protein